MLETLALWILIPSAVPTAQCIADIAEGIIRRRPIRLKFLTRRNAPLFYGLMGASTYQAFIEIFPA